VLTRAQVVREYEDVPTRESAAVSDYASVSPSEY
jgi:hypothetical protein